MKNNLSIIPCGDRILVEPDKSPDRTDAGIYIPEQSKQKPRSGTVLAVSTDNSLGLEVGNRVIFGQYAGTEIEYTGTKCLVVSCEDILAKIAEGDR